jgi:hypothetical protein
MIKTEKNSDMIWKIQKKCKLKKEKIGKKWKNYQVEE